MQNRILLLAACALYCCRPNDPELAGHPDVAGRIDQVPARMANANAYYMVWIAGNGIVKAFTRGMNAAGAPVNGIRFSRPPHSAQHLAAKGLS